MINRPAIQDRVREWGLTEQVVEKDYVLGWVLWGIGTDPLLSAAWVFKGGTCLKKCYIETYRFSEDLDFTVLPRGPLQPEQLRDIIGTMLARVHEASGIVFDAQAPVFRSLPSGSVEGRVYYRGPLQTRQPARIKLDLSGSETVIRPSVLRRISHPFPDELPEPAEVRCYAFDELFAEKIRAMGERGRPRDLYDIVNLFWRHDLRAQPDLIRTALGEKCETKGVPLPTYATLLSSPHRAELESEWDNMLRHQLPVLPPFEQFWDALEALFGWLEGRSVPEELAPIGVGADEDEGWSPPPTIWNWGAGVPLETIRFAGANRLCVDLDYQGRRRVIEPYSLRRTRTGNLLLHAIRADDRQHRAYRVDRMAGVTVTTRPFRPVYRVEFAQTGPLMAPPAVPRSSSLSSRWSAPSRAQRARTTYIIECPTCAKRFRRVQRNLVLKPHNAPDGWACSGRRGYLVDTEYA